MTRHPLDGNMIAADRHHSAGDDPRQGMPTKCCGGVLEYPDDDETDDAPLSCSECGEEAK